MQEFKYTSIDLFSGPGGLCTGFKWAGIQPLIAVEWSDWTVETYRANHNADVLVLNDYLEGILENCDDSFLPNDRTLLIHGDIRKVTNELIDRILQNRFGVDKVDIVTGGAPCVSFSMAGQRKEDDDRNNLFLNLERIAKHVDAKMVLFENVKGLFSKKVDGIDEKMFEIICDEFERPDEANGVAFNLASRNKNDVLLMSSDYGVPQHRERIILVGVNSKLKATFNYPNKLYGEGRTYPYVTVGDAIMDLPEVKLGEETEIYTFNLESVTEPHRRDFLEKMRGIKLPVPEHVDFNENVITSNKAVNQSDKMVARLGYIRQGEGMKQAADRLFAEGRQDIRDHVFPRKLYAARNRRLREDKPCFTVTSHCFDEMVHPFENRSLTPREAARLQSFPDWYSFQGPYVKFHSDSDRYKQIGDAIPPLLAYSVGVEVCKTLDEIYTADIISEDAYVIQEEDMEEAAI